jgi:hypothetical protein
VGVRAVVVGALSVLAAVALAACGASTGGSGPAGPSGNRLAALSSAIAATNDTRAALLADVGADDTAVRTADAADQAALAGARDTAAPLIPAAHTDLVAAAASAARARAEVTGYSNALLQLSTATTDAPISAVQKAAIGAVVSAGRAEAAALRTSVAVYDAAFPTYQTVVAVQQLWYTHANAGWFYTPAEAGGAYQVALTHDEAALSFERQAIATANTARPAATDAMTAALTAARTALASLS